MLLQQHGQLFCNGIITNFNEPGIKAPVFLRSQEFHTLGLDIVIAELTRQAGVDENSTARILTMKNPAFASGLVLQDAEGSNATVLPFLGAFGSFLCLSLAEPVCFGTDLE